MDWIAVSRHHLEKGFMQRQESAHVHANGHGDEDANENFAMGRIYK